MTSTTSLDSSANSWLEPANEPLVSIVNRYGIPNTKFGSDAGRYIQLEFHPNSSPRVVRVGDRSSNPADDEAFVFIYYCEGEDTVRTERPGLGWPTSVNQSTWRVEIKNCIAPKKLPNFKKNSNIGLNIQVYYNKTLWSRNIPYVYRKSKKRSDCQRDIQENGENISSLEASNCHINFREFKDLLNQLTERVNQLEHAWNQNRLDERIAESNFPPVESSDCRDFQQLLESFNQLTSRVVALEAFWRRNASEELLDIEFADSMLLS